MTRFWAFTALALVAMAAGLTPVGNGKEKDKDKNIKVEGKFTKDDLKDAERGGPSHTHVVQLKKGKVYTIDMVSTDVDSFLRILDAKGTQLAEDDDSGGDLNAQILFNCPKDGDYKIVCTTFGADKTVGNYTLTVKTSTSTVQQPSTSHTKMIGENAPDFTADFAINGNAGSLSDLDGKVVLLDFCDVRSSQSIALLPRLAEWHKTYKAKGLAIVSITYYPSDIGQALAFDDDTGRVKTVKKTDHKSDRALFSAFAAHHKVTHLLMTLPKEGALDAYNAYAVNGVPQMVLIDRKGIVRMIDLGGEKNSVLVEAEIKKLLAAK